MAAISVELPHDLQEFVEAKVKQGRFTNVNDYVVALVDAARKQRSEIEAALKEGLESGPAQEWSRKELQGIKQRVSKGLQREYPLTNHPYRYDW